MTDIICSSPCSGAACKMWLPTGENHYQPVYECYCPVGGPQMHVPLKDLGVLFSMVRHGQVYFLITHTNIQDVVNGEHLFFYLNKRPYVQGLK